MPFPLAGQQGDQPRLAQCRGRLESQKNRVWVEPTDHTYSTLGYVVMTCRHYGVCRLYRDSNKETTVSNRIKNVSMMLGGLVAGVAMMVTAAACVPPAEPEIEDGAITTWDDGELMCGVNAKPAIDQDGYGNWWAYCEPALID